MLDPDEPNTHTQNPIESPAAPPAPRRRRAASRPAGPPSSALNAPKIESTAEVAEILPEPLKGTLEEETTPRADLVPGSDLAPEAEVAWQADAPRCRGGAPSRGHGCRGRAARRSPRS